MILGVWFWRRVLRRSASAPILVFIIGAKCQLVLLVLRVIVLCELHQGPRGADRVTLARLEIKVPMQATEVVFGQRYEALEPCTFKL